MHLRRSIALLFTILMFSCNGDKITGSGNVVTQERNVTGFTGVITNGSTKAFIRMDSIFAVSVKGYENLLPYLETNVVSGILQVGFKDNVSVSNDNTELHVSLPMLDYVQTNGTGDMIVTGDVTGSDHLKASVNGLANISVEKGSADEFEGEITGSGNISALGFQCKNAKVNITGDGDVEIAVSDKLDVTITGNGNVYYHGSPQISLNITGNGQVVPKGSQHEIPEPRLSGIGLRITVFTARRE